MSESIDELSRQLINVKNVITDLNSQVKDLKSEREDLERRLLAVLQAVGLNQARNEYGTFTIQETIVPSDIDWEKFHAWILENDMLHLLQRRVNVKDYRDMIEMGEEIPGTTPYKATKILTKQGKS